MSTPPIGGPRGTGVPSTSSPSAAQQKKSEPSKTPLQIARDVVEKLDVQKHLLQATMVYGERVSSKPGFNTARVDIRKVRRGQTQDVQVHSNGRMRNIRITYDPDPASGKKTVGDIAQARARLSNCATTDEAKREWSSLNKHDVSAVKGFMNRLNLNPEQKAKFASDYLTGYYNNPGKDIHWDGARCQDLINAVPMDTEGRKLLDCEGHIAVAQELLGQKDVKPYAVTVGRAEPGTRNHQVAVIRERDAQGNPVGNTAHVLSNNVLTKIDNARSLSDEALIQRADRNHRDPVLDRSGVGNYGTENYKVGFKYTVPSSGRAQGKMTVVQINDAQTMTALLKERNGSSCHMTVRVHPDTNRLETVARDPRPGDTLSHPRGTITVRRQLPATPGQGGMREYDATLSRGGRQVQVRLQVLGQQFRI